MQFLAIRVFLLQVLILFAFRAGAQEEEPNVQDSVIIDGYLNDALGLIYTDPDSAYILSLTAIEMADELKYYKLGAQGRINLAAISSVRGDYSEALHNDLMVLKIAEAQQDSNLLALSRINVGDDLLSIRNFNGAYEEFVIALDIAGKIDEELYEAIAIFNMGKVLKELDQYTGALSKFEQSLAKSITVQDYEGLIFTNSEIGHTYFLQSDFESANKFFEKALLISDTVDIPNARAELLERHALNQIHLDEPRKAESLFEESLVIGESLGSIDLQAKAYNGLATMGLYVSDYDLTESNIEKSLALTEGSNKKKIESESYRILSLMESAKGNYEEALEYFTSYHRLNSELLEEEKNVQLNTLQLQYDLEKKDFEITSLNNREQMRVEQMENQRMLRNILVILLCLSVLLLFLVHRSGQRRRRTNELLIEHKEEVLKQKNELAELNKLKDKFFSILAHDLRSPLRSLSGVLRLMEDENLSKEETKQLVGAISRRTEETQALLDNLLEWALIQMNKITVNKTEFELRELVDKNIRFFKETNDKPIHISNRVGDCKAYADQNMIDLVMRNLLSNAIKYTDEGGEISVEMERRNGSILVHVQDNGAGLTEELKQILLNDSKLIRNGSTATGGGTGLGLKISKEFVERNGGSLSLQSEIGKGSTFTFSLPVEGARKAG